MTFAFVCKHCGNETKTSDEEAKGKVEVNFRDSLLYFYCPHCNKINKLVLAAEKAPYPKMKTRR